jgi:hypothetical protein
MIRFLTRLYRSALALYPRRMRAIYAQEQSAVFSDLLEDAAISGHAHVLKRALREFLDFPGNLFQAYCEDKMINLRIQTFLRWSARVVSILISAFLLLFIIGEGLPEILSGQGADLLPFLPLLGLALAGTALIWFREGFGACLMILGAIAMAVYIRDAGMFLVYSLPYLLAGVLILAGHWLRKRSRPETMN